MTSFVPKQTLTYTMTIEVSDTRPLVVIKSHSDEFSAQTIEFLTKQAPGGEPVVISLPIREDPNRKLAITREDKLNAMVEDWATMPNRVYDSVAWLVRNHSEYLSRAHRIVLVPYGDSRIQTYVMNYLRGFLGREPELLNMVELNGVLVPNPKLPIMDPGTGYYNGRNKLRQIVWRHKLPGWAEMGKELNQNTPKPLPA